MFAAVALLLAAAMPAAPAAPAVTIVDTRPGTGSAAQAGQRVLVRYTGWLSDGGKRGKKFDSSDDNRGWFDFGLGAGEVIPGWDQGVAGMKIGGKRTLTIPPELGYGATGAGDGLIPPNATLIFDVELLAVHPVR